MRAKWKSVNTSWRDVLPIHPAANLFPDMTSDELRTLGEDIVKNGLYSSIALWRADPKASAQLLDGRNRLDAIEMATGKPVEVNASSIVAGEFLATDRVIELDGRKVDPWVYATSANFHRRHLTTEQKREAIAKLIKALPEKSDRQIAAMLGVSHHTVGTVRAEMERRGQIAHVETRTDSKGREQPASKPRKAGKLAKATGGHQPKGQRVTRGPDAPATLADQGVDKHLTEQRDDIGLSSASELARKDARIEELQAEKRQLEIKITGLQSEITELKTRREPASASRCSICHEKKQVVLRPVFICENCVHIYEVREAAPPADDGLGILACLDRRNASRPAKGD